MVYTFEKFIRRCRSYFSRSPYLLRLLGISKKTTDNKSHKPGLLIIQIDGLAYTQLQRALSNGNMPFLQSLLEREHYQLHHLYSGLPSSTPAVQGELFYGVKTCVPGFSFMKRENSNVVMMLEPSEVKKVETDLSKKGEGLLVGGSSYANIFSGGAKETHFCSTSIGWDDFIAHLNPIKAGLFILFNFYSALRIIALIFIELVLGLIDTIRGTLFYRHDFLKELFFVVTRVGICVWLRELVTIGIKLDIARGLPVVHANFLAYDEQSHRRGPKSKFAHWSLKGIDSAIARIWHAQQRSNQLDYRLWVYSDHGQEHTIPYPRQFNVDIEEQVECIFDHIALSKKQQSTDQQQAYKLSESEQLQRFNLLGGKYLQGLLPLALREKIIPLQEKTVITVAMGPLGFIYLKKRLLPELKQAFIHDLINKAHIPLVMTRSTLSDPNKKVVASTLAGDFYLPLDKAQILGKAHPFLDEVSRDLLDLCYHPDSGDFIISGWQPEQKAYSFPIENGAHAGPGSSETHAFALLPDDITPELMHALHNKSYLRPLDLRRAALHFLGRDTLIKKHSAKTVKSKAGVSQAHKAQKNSLRIMTYNVHSCIGMDGKVSPQRIARTIKQYHPDVVALQELDVGRQRTHGIDQAHLIAQLLEMDFHFHPALHIEEERYGDAILTHLPLSLIKKEELPTIYSGKTLIEPRGALWVQVEVAGSKENKVNIINTHLGLTAAERRLQTNALLGQDWIKDKRCHGPLILCGDFNAMPWQYTYRKFNKILNDVQKQVGRQSPRKTFSGRYPALRIDHIFVDNSITTKEVIVPNNSLTRVASDHLPLIADLTY